MDPIKKILKDKIEEKEDTKIEENAVPDGESNKKEDNSTNNEENNSNVSPQPETNDNDSNTQNIENRELNNEKKSENENEEKESATNDETGQNQNETIDENRETTNGEHNNEEENANDEHKETDENVKNGTEEENENKNKEEEEQKEDNKENDKDTDNKEDENKEEDQNDKNKEEQNEENNETEEQNENNQEGQQNGDNQEEQNDENNETVEQNENNQEEEQKELNQPKRVRQQKEEEEIIPIDDNGKYNDISTDLLDKFVQKFEQTSALPPFEYQTVLSSYIQHKNIQCVVKGDYLQASRYENLGKLYSDCYTKHAVRDKIMTKTEGIDKSIEQIRIQIAEVRAQYEERIKKEKEKDADEIHTLMNGHEKAINAFNQYWSDPENLRQYCKGSKRLIQMRAKQKSLLLAKMFDEATEIRREADILEREETLKAQETIQQEVNAKRKTLEKKQNEELMRTRLHSVKTVSELRAQMEREIEILEARIRKLKQDKQSVHNSENTQASQILANRIEYDTATISPRSKKLYDKYRRSTKPKRLILKPLCPSLVKPANKRPKTSFPKKE